ncbi:MAG: cell wall metabolism sensor histidine kinase WalK [Paenibacillaceae bacterium]|nr:cell wall metabolism sensor histidine kinase WalK [Paenibacillaceae bacterium]
MKGNHFFGTVQAKLIIIYVLLILFAMQLIGIYFIKTMENSFMSNYTESLNQQAGLLAELVGSALTATQESGASKATAGDGKKTPTSELNEYVSNWYKVSNADVQIIDANGIVLSTSQQNAQAIVGQKNTQQVVSRALQNIKDNDNERTITDTDGTRKKVIVKPVSGPGDKIIGAVYIAASIEDIYKTTNRVNRIFLTGTLIALALTALLGVILSHTITSPIKEITRQVTSVAKGEYNQRVKVASQDEIGQLGQAFNEMTERLKDALALNEEEKDKLASILANMSDGVIATDDAGRVIVVNHRAKTMLQLGDNEPIGRELGAVLGLPQEKLKLASARPAGAGAGAERFDGAGRGENSTLFETIDPEDEESRQLRATFTSIHRREKGVTGTIVVLQDVTEQEELERARREFVANVSHELRTPLTTIKSYLEALDDGALEEPQLAQRFVGVTRSETERMIRLVSDLLHLSRFDSNQARIERSWTDVTEMLEEVADRFSFQLQQRNISIYLFVEVGIDRLLLDRDKIDQVLDNLVSNAIKYTADYGRIDLSARKLENGAISFSVEDNGIGIPKKDLDRIFERFYRVDKARSRNMGGTGLGLSIAREIIKAHGGTIALESEYNRGTKVSFVLPAALEGGEAV